MTNCHCHTEGAERPKYLKYKNNNRYFAIAQYDKNGVWTATLLPYAKKLAMTARYGNIKPNYASFMPPY